MKTFIVYNAQFTMHNAQCTMHNEGIAFGDGSFREAGKLSMHIFVNIDHFEHLAALNRPNGHL
ncbi:MAG: hypothetical protein IJ746_08135, partial [Ruminococcus sp.]|nr:hypothetical protein [Ruminococcus sp.]